MTMIEVKNVHYSYPSGVKALSGISTSINPGECVAVIGQNGSGKTTLIKHLNGLLKPSSGQVFIDGESIEGKEPSELARHIGLVFQNPDDQIFSNSIEKEVSFGPKNLGFPQDKIDEQVDQFLKLTGLNHMKDIHPYDLTITERKVLCLASVLAMDPSVIILDEPTTAQDQFGIRKLIDIIQHLLQIGKTIITVTHDMSFVAEVFSRTIVMRQGEIILDGETDDVFRKRDLLLTTHVKPSPMAILSKEINAPKDAVTVPKMVDWIVSVVQK